MPFFECLSPYMRIHLRIKGQFIKVLDVLQRIKGQLVKVHLRFAQVLNLRWGIFDPRPGNAMYFLEIRVFLFPQLVAQPHPVERAFEVDQVDEHLAGPMGDVERHPMVVEGGHRAAMARRCTETA